MANLLRYLIVHCSSTPPTMKVTKGMLEEWHMGPLFNKDGSVNYLGLKYKTRRDLPKDFINGKPILSLSGRGWDRLGYSDKFDRDGTIENLTPYDDDDLVEQNEVTWGATGVNHVARHIMLVGGWRGQEHGGTFPFTDIFTSSQFISLNRYFGKQLLLHPNIKIVGHRDIPNANKTCPNFDVIKFCRALSIQEKNIGL